MTTALDPSDFEACRAQVDELFGRSDFAAAEAALRTATARWPDRLGLQLKLARSIASQDRWSEARSMIETIVRARDDLPNWARPTFAHFGYAIASGVKLDIQDEAIAGFMRTHFETGNYERIECEFLAQVLQPHDVVLEVGGGIGFIGAFAMLSEPTATVISYEANPALMGVVARTQELNGVSFEMRNAMLGETDGTSDFFVNKAFWASSATHDYGGASTIQVPMQAVHRVMAERTFNVVVMDIEGGEIELVPLMDLSGVERFIIETHPKLTGKSATKRLLGHLSQRYGLVSQREAGGVHLLVRQP